LVAKNDITGDSIQSRAPTKAYEESMDRIFGNKEEERARKRKDNLEYFARLQAETEARINGTD
jgi:hypothetical protein